MSAYRFTGTGEAKSTSDVRPRPRPVRVELDPERVDLLVAADHGILVTDADGRVWRDETRHPAYGTGRRHVTGPVQKLGRAGWLAADAGGVWRLTDAGRNVLAQGVR